MKTKILAISLLFIFLHSLLLHSQDYYWNDGEKIFVNKSNHRKEIMIQDTLTFHFLEKLKYFEPNFYYKILSYNFYNNHKITSNNSLYETFLHQHIF